MSSTPTQQRRRTSATTITLSVAAAVLAALVALIHVQDQGGIPGSKDPAYVGVGYWVLEVAGLAAAALLLVPATRQRLSTWALAAGVAVGPLVGYTLSRGPGLPDYTDDRGNWTESLGLISLVVEALLLVIAAAGTRAVRDDAR